MRHSAVFCHLGLEGKVEGEGRVLFTQNALCCSGKITGWHFVSERGRHRLHQCLLYHGKSEKSLGRLPASLCHQDQHQSELPEAVAGSMGSSPGGQVRSDDVNITLLPPKIPPQKR